MQRIITLLTDFGTADGYVGEMKAVLSSMAPACMLVDVAHDVAAQDVDGGRLALARYWRRFPATTVHIAIVDPGVGGSRAAIVVESEGRFLVGPDNGILSPALLHPDARCLRLPVSPLASATFHGRDVFAPAAAQLANGISVDALGEPFPTPVVRRTPEAVRARDGAAMGVVISIDRFGNIITNLVARRGGTVEIGGRQLAIRRSYEDVLDGELVALVGSNGLIEIATRNGSAAAAIGVRRGAPAILRQSSS